MNRYLHRSILPLLLIAALLIPSIPVSAAGISVAFERTYESPVSVTFRATVTTTDKDWKDLPIEVLFDRIGLDKLSDVTIVEISRTLQSRVVPVKYESREFNYTSVKGIYTLDDGKASGMDGLLSFKDYDKLGGKVVKEGTYQKFDSKTMTWTWHEDVAIETITETWWQEAATPLTQFSPKAIATEAAKTKAPAILTATLASKAEKTPDNDTGWGAQTRVFDVTILTGLLTSNGGWGSDGLLIFDIGGTLYFDNKNSSWWSTTWLYRQKITFTNAASADNLAAFPVLVSPASGNDVYLKAKANGYDLRFVDADGTTNLNYERVGFDTTAKTAEIWVNVPQIDSGSNTDYIWMYYGNSAATDGQNVNATWNSGYVAVYHMNDGADRSYINDSTINNKTGTKTSNNNPAMVAGLIGNGQYYDASGQAIAYTVTSAPTSITAECVFKRSGNSYGSYHEIIKMGLGLYFNIYVFSAGDKINAQFRSTTPTTYSIVNTGLNITEWNYLVQTFDNASLTMRAYVNGLLGSGGAVVSDNPLVLSSIPTIGVVSDYKTNGIVDEVRLSSVARSASWIAATNLNLTNAYSTYGSVEGKPLSVTALTATASGNNLVLSWTKGTLSTDTVIVRGELQTPASLTDGITVYSGTASTFTDLGANTDVTPYYYAIWAKSTFDNGAFYSDTAASVTAGGEGLETLATAVADGISGLSTQVSSISTIWTALTTSWVFLAIELSFMLALVVISYWKRTIELYVLAGLIAILFGFQWLIPATDTFYIGIACTVLGLTTITRGVFAYRGRSRRS